MSDTIGQQLKKTREERNLTIEQVVKATLIRARHLEALESDDFESLPSPVQARAFLRIYSEFLGLSVDTLIDRQRQGMEVVSEPVIETGNEIEAAAPVLPAPPVITEPSPAGLNSLKSRLDEWLARLKNLIANRNGSEPSVPPATEMDELDRPALSKAEAIPAISPLQEEVEETGSPAEQYPGSQAVFTAIGSALRQRRESLSLTIEEIERHTHVRKHYLQALEEGAFDHLPSSVQTRGMLNNYARFLEMDVDTLLLRFAEGLQLRRLERQPKPALAASKPAVRSRFKIEPPAFLRKYLSMDILVGGGLIMVLVVLAVWGTSRIIGVRSSETPQLTAPPISNIIIDSPEAQTVTPLPTGALTPSSDAPTTDPNLAVTIQPGAVQVVVVAQQSAWVRVLVDKKIQFEGRIDPGRAYPYSGNTQIEVLTGNGAAVSILYNNSDLGTMGSFGEVVDRIYTVAAILNPTATYTPSPSISPIPSITPRPSATPRFQVTPRPSATPAY